MVTPQSPRAPTRRSRKSIAHLPTSDLVDKGNNTVQGITSAGSLARETGRKSRSKSIGPGGLEALNETAGNKQKVSSKNPQSIYTSH